MTLERVNRIIQEHKEAMAEVKAKMADSGDFPRSFLPFSPTSHAQTVLLVFVCHQAGQPSEEQVLHKNVEAYVATTQRGLLHTDDTGEFEEAN